MASFINKKLILDILQELNSIDSFDEDQIQYIKLLAQVETHHLFQSSLKFMRNDKRQVVIAQDVIAASKDNGHTSFILQRTYQHSKKEDSIIYTQNLQFEMEAQALLTVMQIQKPKIQGKWIYIKGKIPALTSNIELKCLTEQQKRLQSTQNESRQLVNIIKDDPYSLLTHQQYDYFQQMCSAMDQNVKPNGDFTVEGDLNSLLPFFLKFLGERQLNQTSACFLLKIIENKYIWRGIEYNLKKILNILLAYRGIYSFEMGNKIAQIVDRFSDKYPILRDIYVEYPDSSYSTILKKISFQLILGISFKIDASFWEKCEEDCQNNDKMAILCMNTLLSYSTQLKCLKQIPRAQLNAQVYWQPCSELNGDPYLHMF